MGPSSPSQASVWCTDRERVTGSRFVERLTRAHGEAATKGLEQGQVPGQQSSGGEGTGGWDRGVEAGNYIPGFPLAQVGGQGVKSCSGANCGETAPPPRGLKSWNQLSR